MEIILDTQKQMKDFLELVQPLPVKYGYIRGVIKDENYITYRSMNTNPRIGIGNKLISERTTFIVTVQTKTAEQNLIYSALIRYATSRSKVRFVSDDMRRDVTVENGWINSIVLSMYSSKGEGAISQDTVRDMLQEIANRYIMVTSIYKKPFEESIIENFTVPPLDKEEYSYIEVLQLKQEYLDRYLLSITEY